MMYSRWRSPFTALASLAMTPFGAKYAHAAAEQALDGSKLSVFWVAPFAGILLSLALFPVIAPNFWHRRYGLVALFWGAAFLLPFAATFGMNVAFQEFVHVLLLEYLPFIVLIGALFIISGGIYVGGNLRGSPSLNTSILFLGTILASFAGTTGAAMIFIRPLIRANIGRAYKVHVMVFFIFLVCNIGGALTPLGDPPLFLGYLEGVRFFWPLQFLWPQMVFLSVLLLTVFFCLDAYLFRKEKPADDSGSANLEVRGLVNVPLVIMLVGMVAVSGTVDLGSFTIFGTKVSRISLLRDVTLAALAAASLVVTPVIYRERNEFTWEPVNEVAKLFAAVFITIVPAIAILKAGAGGAFAPFLTLLGSAEHPNNIAYFWLTGTLSSFLDNAPTYLVFFNAAGGDAGLLMTSMAQTLTAISAGAVFMGANTYVGNAPNFMVKAIAEHQGVKMPSFFGFMAWSGLILVPAFILLTLIFYR